MNESQALIIDDNLKNLNILARLLSNEGVSSIQVMNPVQLEATLNEIDDVQIIFLDLELPNTNGYQILQHIKSDARFEFVPVIAYTVHVSEINVALQHGFDGFIGKPLDSDRFPNQLARIFSGEGVWETA